MSPFARGARDGAPFLFIMVPFGALFGVIGTEAGLSFEKVVAFSAIVVAGASQLTTLGLAQEGAPLAVAVLSGLAVNLRMMMYSAALVPHLGDAPPWQRAVIGYLLVDQTYALAQARFEDAPGWSTRDKVAYFAGTASYVFPAWVGATAAGALLGAALPDWLPLGFAVPLAFVALVAPMLRTAAHAAAAVTSVVLTLALAGVPWNGGLLIAALIAIAVGAEVERRTT
ncbi:AzlC family ABC transporter permease [Jannaschia sp. Os4]|uniref:AzlC family ABC transporter permease n=1 Tax=Jannaschia sp. Os4 TaxID=2807617 RepID=UPI00193A57DE|nr:AzlC family ABC transporter permease [Jannaschia sp. Os4]MBM2576145.1 AzlC family ABC transporter permease [Jannaschia sp. Os4]